MDLFLILIVVLAVFIPLLSWFTGKYAEFWVKKFVTEKTDAVYEIIRTGKAPLSWNMPLVNKISGGKFQKKIALIKIRSLIRYMEHNSVFPADKREEAVCELDAIMKEWDK